MEHPTLNHDACWPVNKTPVGDYLTGPGLRYTPQGVIGIPGLSSMWETMREIYPEVEEWYVGLARDGHHLFFGQVSASVFISILFHQGQPRNGWAVLWRRKRQRKTYSVEIFDFSQINGLEPSDIIGWASHSRSVSLA